MRYPGVKTSQTQTKQEQTVVKVCEALKGLFFQECNEKIRESLATVFQTLID